MTRIRQFAIIALMGFSHHCFASASLDYTITYKNETGSTLTLTWHPEKDNAGTVNGLFTSHVSGCSQSKGMPAAVSGVFIGNALAMTVSYPKCDRVMAMTGSLKNNKETLQALWLTPSPSREYSRDGAGSYQVGSDSYTKVAS